MSRIISGLLVSSIIAATTTTWVLAADTPPRPAPHATTRPHKTAYGNSQTAARGPQAGQSKTTISPNLPPGVDPIHGPANINRPIDPNRFFNVTSPSSAFIHRTPPQGIRGRFMGTPPTESRTQENARRQIALAQRMENPTHKNDLSLNDIARLQNQEANLHLLERSFQLDGKVTKDEGNELTQALTNTSPLLWTQVPDTEGQQKSVDRFQRTVTVKNDLTQKLESGDMTHTEARLLLDELQQLAALKRRLSTEDLTDDKRAELEDAYDALISHNFQPTPLPPLSPLPSPAKAPAIVREQ